MKGFASALFIAAAATGALAQVGPEVDPSEQFGILTLHRYSSICVLAEHLVPQSTSTCKHGL
jgi:hypothetical protein